MDHAGDNAAVKSDEDAEGDQPYDGFPPSLAAYHRIFLRIADHLREAGLNDRSQDGERENSATNKAAE